MSFSHLPFTQLPLDRHAIRRDDPDWLEQCLCNENCRIVARYQHNYPVDENNRIKLLARREIEEIATEELTYYFLGEVVIGDSNHFIFTTTLTDSSDSDISWSTLRKTSLDDPIASLAFYAQGLLNWHDENKFCHACGSVLLNKDGGNRQKCSNTNCTRDIFPRINPAIIVLLTHGEQCLLAHAHHFRGDIPMYSCLAGYMETGEDFEQTLNREVYEEVGLEVGEILYKGNQPWPFPQSLMIGFHAESKSQAMTFHDGEIKSAEWFTAESLTRAVLDKRVLLPTPKSISYYLIEDWFEEHSTISLFELINQVGS